MKQEDFLRHEKCHKSGWEANVKISSTWTAHICCNCIVHKVQRNRGLGFDEHRLGMLLTQKTLGGTKNAKLIQKKSMAISSEADDVSKVVGTQKLHLDP